MSGPRHRAAGPPGEDHALVDALGRAAREVAAQEARAGTSPSPSPAAWYRLARIRAERTGPATWWPRPASVAAIVAGVACVVAVAVSAVAWRHSARPGVVASDVRAGRGIAAEAALPLTFSVQGAALASANEIDAGRRSDAVVRFSDGTDIDLFEETRLSVTGRDADGARLRLRSGRARFQVVHRPRAAWTVDAGPYVIEVTGTVFEARWSETEQVVEVKMQSGSVRVSGPLLTDRMPLRTGQRLVVRPGAGDVHIDEGRWVGESPETPAASPGAPWAVTVTSDGPPAGGVAGRAAEAADTAHRLAQAAPGVPASGLPNRPRQRLALASPHLAAPQASPSSPSAFEPPPIAVSAPAPDLEKAAGGPPEAAPAGGGPGRWMPRRWAARVATGESQAVLTDAEQIGFDVTLAGADGQDLSAFADAARYGGRPDLADRALIEARRRFPGTGRAQAAAFLLGRAADDRGDTHSGLAWYRRYLTEAPRGPYAADALGREMVAVEKLRGREAAAPLAAEYLRRFPNGTYLLRARALLDDR